ncbi:hypothetical protein [Sporosalibacterium faouarense]|uniref:hypothetical protein n=1 Tax=Sporosalibacterium faouarense TaxID=516123 RepID=UPI00192BE331|nr:hypothetical protein [Sporosalibacterium faouarense]
MKKNIILLIIIITNVLASTGCQNKEFDAFSEKFEDIYFNTVKSIDSSNTLKSLEGLQSEEKKQEIEKLGLLLENIREKVSKENKNQYDRYVKWYNGLLLLRNSYDSWESFDVHEKAEIGTEFVLISLRKRNKNE